MIGKFAWSRFGGKPHPEVDSAAVSVATEAPPLAPRNIAYVERTLHVQNGAYIDLPDVNAHRGSRIRISVKAIENTEFFSPAARIHVDLGGALITCGRKVKQEGVNAFLVPVRDGHEEEYSVFRFFSHSNGFAFMRIFVTHINPHAGDVDINFVQTRGAWS